MTRRQEDWRFEENINYGFRRNLWGMRRIGLGIAIAGVVVLGGLFVVAGVLHERIPPALAARAVANLVIVAFRVFWITPSWVRIPADAYASRLIEALDLLT